MSGLRNLPVVGMDTARFLNEEAAHRGADSEVWEMAQETDELVCRGGTEQRRSEVVTGVTALTVWKDGTEGYAVQVPGPADVSLLDTALAVGRALPVRPEARTPPEFRPVQVAPVFPVLPELDETVAARLRKLSAGAGNADIELRASTDRSRILLQRGSVEPLRYETGAFQLQARVSVKGDRVGHVGHQMFGRSAGTVLDAAERTELDELVTLARTLASEPVREPEYDAVLLDGRVMVKLFMLAVPAFLLDSVLEGRSPLRDRTGERIGALGLSLVDDPISDESPMYIPWDDEGTECRSTELLKDGVLQGFLSSRRSAGEAGTDSTGSGRRGPSGEMPTVQPGHLELHPTTLLGTTPRAGNMLLKVVQANGAHTSNAITGDFSIGANAVLVSPDGVQRNAGNITLAGNVFDLLRRIDGHDGRVRTHRSHPRSFVASPGVWTSCLSIAW